MLLQVLRYCVLSFHPLRFQNHFARAGYLLERISMSPDSIHRDNRLKFFQHLYLQMPFHLLLICTGLLERSLVGLNHHMQVTSQAILLHEKEHYLFQQNNKTLHPHLTKNLSMHQVCHYLLPTL